MSLYSSIRLASNALRANEIGLAVVGQNIANANTPGYIREEAVFAPAGTERRGNLILGLGVRVEAVIQKIDHFLEERLRGAVSERAGGEALEQMYAQLEGIVGELSDTDLSTALNDFFSSIAEVLNQPESVSVRNLAMLQGKTLAQDVSRMSQRVRTLRADANKRIGDMAEDINRLVEEIRVLNVRIAETEGGDLSNSDAVGLRDQRLVALENLSRLIDIRVVEQESGGVTVYTGGDFLVFDGVSREVEVVLETDRGLNTAHIHLSETDSRLMPAAGELRGLIDARDTVLGGFLDELDDFARTLIWEFNRLHSGGQGLKGYTSLTGEHAVDGARLPLDEAGLPFIPENGSFQVLVRNRNTGMTRTTDIRVDLSGTREKTTLEGLAAALDAIDGLSATITADGKLHVQSDSPDHDFSFAHDTSGALAALGINTFFTGSSAVDMGINSAIARDPELFAASRGGIGADTDNAVDLARFLDLPLATRDGATLAVLYDRMVGEMAQGSTVAQAVAEGAKVFEVTLRGQKMATSGVSLDEEAVKMMAYQHAFQASSRFIATINELFGILVNL